MWAEWMCTTSWPGTRISQTLVSCGLDGGAQKKEAMLSVTRPLPHWYGAPTWTVTWGKKQTSFLSHIIFGFRVTATEAFPLADRFRYSVSWALTSYLMPHIVPDKNDKVALSVSYLRYMDSEVIIIYRILPWWIKSADIQGYQVVSLIVWKTQGQYMAS